nr:MAG TPA: YopX protein [Caudoviricetes sp.]
MREILFRGKRVDNGEWVEGYLWCTHSNTRISAHISTLDGDIVDIYTDTIGQYTGLKDKNGVKIFEGDIVVCNRYEEKVDYLVLLKDLRDLPSELYGSSLNYREVVGNIYENPELLGVE